MLLNNIHRAVPELHAVKSTAKIFISLCTFTCKPMMLIVQASYLACWRSLGLSQSASYSIITAMVDKKHSLPLLSDSWSLDHHLLCTCMESGWDRERARERVGEKGGGGNKVPEYELPSNCKYTLGVFSFDISCFITQTLLWCTHTTLVRLTSFPDTLASNTLRHDNNSPWPTFRSLLEIFDYRKGATPPP